MPSKVTFDGVNKLIIVNDGETVIDVKADIYSTWKNWVLLSDNAKFLPAIRTIGGDAIGGGQFAGDLYFLTNNWSIRVNNSCEITGVIFSDDNPSPFSTATATNIVTNKVSSLVNTVSTGGGGTAPTVQQIRTEMDTNSTKLAGINTNVISQSTQLTTINNNIAAVPDAVRVELQPELTHLLTLQNGQGLDSTQATMLLEIYRLYGLDPTRPLIVTNNTRSAGDIQQTVISDETETVVTRI